MIDNLTYLYINWKNKLYENDNDSNFSIAANLPNDMLNKYTHCSLLEISIPKSFYNLEDFKFDLYENNELIVIHLDNGSYSKSQFFKMLSAAMTTSSINSIIYTVSDEIWNYTYDTGKLLITWTNALIEKYITLPYNNYTFGILGFDENINNKYYFSNNIWLLWKNVINMNQQSSIFLHSSIVNNIYNDNIINSQSILSSVFFSQNRDMSFIIKQFD